MIRATAWLALLLVGCGGGGLTAAQYPAVFARTLCQVQARCRLEAAYLEQQCEDDTVTLYAPDLARAMAAGKAAFDAAQAQSCLDGLTAAGCDRTPMTVQQACERAVTGTVADHAPCSWTWECKNGRCAQAGPGVCPGTCSGASAEGAACDPPCDLRQGLRCIAGHCSKPHLAGGACTSDEDCDVQLFCDGFDNHCAPRGTAQFTCQADAECAAGTYCDVSAASPVCKRKLAAGAACDAASVAAVAAVCADGLVCKGYKATKPATTPGACAAAAQAGGACVAADVTGCLSGLRCSGAACAEKPVSGPCASGADCKDGAAYCDGAQCQLSKDDGAACTASAQCASHLCGPSSNVCESGDPACHEP